MIKAAIFDLDGTLLDMKLRVKEAKMEFVKRLGEWKIDTSWIDIRIPTEEVMSRLIKMYGFSRKKLINLVDEVFIPYEIEAAERAELRRGIKEVLIRLRRMGLRLAVASNNGELGVNLALKKTSIRRFFEAVVTRNDVNKMKPDGAVIMEALKRLGVDASEAVYIGDTAYDVVAARKAGVRCIAVSGGAHPESLLVNEKPDVLVGDVSEIPKALKELMHRR